MTTPAIDPPLSQSWPRFVRIGVILVCCAGIAATAGRIYKKYQTPGRFDESNQGYCDFHNGTYFPSKAFLDRNSPYGMAYADAYLVDRPIPSFSPLVLAAHAPLALLPLRISEILFFAFMLGCIATLAVMSVRYSLVDEEHNGWMDFRSAAFPILCVATAIIFSRAGHGTLFTGYWTFELVIGALLALEYGKRKPTWGAVGLAVTSFKPTYAVPLALVMLARGHLRAVILGTTISVVLGGACLGWLMLESSPSQFVDDLREAQQVHRDDPREMPVNTWTRVDTMAIVAKWMKWNPDELTQLGTMLLVLVIPCGLIAYLTRQANQRAKHSKLESPTDHHRSGGVIGMLCGLAFLVSFYHHFYDALVLVVPITAMMIGNLPSWKAIPKIHRVLLCLLTLIPLFNYASAEMIINRLHLEGTSVQMVTSLSGVCLAFALGYLCVIAWSSRKQLV